jgi:uncharacterized protein
MIDRKLTGLLQSRLKEFPAVALLGPRQVGKTTLVKSLANDKNQNVKPHIYLDLENPVDLERLSDPRGYLASRSDHLIIIDEIQRMPELFKILRGLIDEGIEKGNHAGQFLLLGSASLELLQQSSESLAGRILYLELKPFLINELSRDDLTTLWLRGGFPRSFLAPTHEGSLSWRDSFITTYLERDIPLLGPRIPPTTLRRFWSMLAHNQGGLLNAAQLAGALSVDGKTVAKYLDLMVDLLLVRRLEPYHANLSKRLVKSPKTYVRDTGLLHSLLRLDRLDDILGHPVAGQSWEGFCIEQIIAASPNRSNYSFYRTATGVELDLILELPDNKTWAIEIKRSTAPKLEKGTHIAIEDVRPDKSFIVYAGEERYPKSEGIEVISLSELVSLLIDLSKHNR